MYKLVEDETRIVRIVADDLKGLFVDPATPPSPLRFIRVSELAVARRGEVAEVELQICDARGEVIGDYYIRAARLGPPFVLDPADPLPDVDASFYGYTFPYPAAGEVWQRLLSPEPLRIGEWAEWPGRDHSSWLHVIQNAWFTAGRGAVRYETAARVEIDGALISTEDSFYCALGEAVNGAGGYFGSNLDALVDCLRSVSSVNTFELHWSNYELSRKTIGTKFCNSIVEIMSDSGVSVVPA